MENLQTQTARVARPISCTLMGNVLGAADNTGSLSITYNKRRPTALKRAATVHVLQKQEPVVRRAS
jgi:hypothetical protein